jgi:cell cycle sensor histidine kinase DivJ
MNDSEVRQASGGGGPEAGGPAEKHALARRRLRSDDIVAALHARIADLTAALDRAGCTERERLSFIAMLGHELRTPLTAITGFADAALLGIHGPPTPAYREYFASIHTAGRHLEAVTDGLLDFARLEAGRFSFDMQSVPARQIVAEARAIAEPLAHRGGIDMSTVTLAGEWQLWADPTRARQILVNLLTNAVKFTPPNGTVGIEAAPAGPQFLDLAVWDTGIGIPPEEQERIFEAFQQAGAPPLIGEAKGVGLGLAISRRLAQGMGGDIGLASTPGKGSRFTVRFPLATAGRRRGA